MAMKLLSPASGMKPATTIVCEGVEWSDLGLRELGLLERVHLKENRKDPCKVCHWPDGVWVENQSSWQTHPQKC